MIFKTIVLVSKNFITQLKENIMKWGNLGSSGLRLPMEHTMKKIQRTEYATEYVPGGKIREKSFFLMPSLKWSWLNNSWCSLYMKASVGMHYQLLGANTEDIPLKSDDDLDESKLRFAYLATPFGWEIGKQKVRGFLEFGIGSNLNLQIGLTYRFGRY